MKTLARTFFFIALIFAVALALDQITELKQFTLYLDQHSEPYKRVTIGMSIAGWVLLGGAFAYGLWTQGKPMSEEEARRFMQTSAGRPRMRRRVFGPVAGWEFHEEVTVSEVKKAFRNGAWLREQRWRPIFVGFLALPLIAFGMFGFFFVIGAPLVKVMCAGALVYATIRTVWAFWKA